MFKKENKEVSSHESTWEKTKDMSTEAWDKTKEFSANTWDKTKEKAEQIKEELFDEREHKCHNDNKLKHLH